MKVLFTAALAIGALGASVSAAQAWDWNWDDPECDCVPNALDVLQDLSAAQTAKNKIEGFKSVSDVTQEAINVGNSVSFDDDITLPDMSSLIQDATGFQFAANYIEFGAGGYTGPEFAYDGETLIDQTQSALNAVNLVSVPALGAPAEQNSSTWQTALNTAEYGSIPGFPFYSGDVTNISQSATNVANSISATEFFTFEDCECVEITQIATGPQLAANSILGSGYGFGAIEGAIQNATNIANSISGSMPSE
ncbi:hypothetical protein [Pelagibacterium sp.]|uniref:hypothetical protein n=1 Tax=Pelagibacterium sp. TaxID=1967288 RepID=UPI003A95494E